MWHSVVVAAFAVGMAAYSLASQKPIKAGNVKDRDIIKELGPRLSPGARIILPNTSDFASASGRWSAHSTPSLSAVIAVIEEEDVRQTVLYANEHDIPFLTKASGHGYPTTLLSANGGIGIWLKDLNHVQISENGKTAVIGGGAIGKHVTDTLWRTGKFTATGGCDAVAMAGPLLGGGRTWLQGQHGLITDHLIEARLVIANGSVINVSNESHQDLFWALRGAGHNFGIVTEFKARIYDVVPGSTWAYGRLFFTEDKLEEVFSTLKALREQMPPQAFALALARSIPELDPASPVIVVAYGYDGPATDARSIFLPLEELDPVSSEVGVVPYVDLNPVLMGGDEESKSSENKRSTIMGFSIGLLTFDVPAVRRSFDALKKLHEEEPALKESYFLIEMLANQGVEAVPAEETAYPHRLDRVVFTILPYYAANSSLDALTSRFGKNIRKILHDGTRSAELNVYVNYAHGDESLESLYGYEPWRLEKLKRLKKEYDPNGKFNHFAPIS